MIFFVDNRPEQVDLPRSRDELQASREKFLVRASSPPDLVLLSQEISGGVRFRNVSQVCESCDLQSFNEDRVFTFVFDAETDAESGADAFEIAEDIKSRYGFLNVMPGIRLSSGEVVFADFDTMLVALQTATASERARFAKRHNLILVDYDRYGNFGIYRSLSREGIQELFDKLAKDKEVRYAELNYFGSDDASDQTTGNSSHEVSNVDFSNYWAHEITRLDAEPNESYGEGVHLAVIDSRIDADHADLRTSIRIEIGELEFNAGRVNESADHGTQVAGLIASRKSIGPKRFLGVAPACQILPISVSLDRSQGLASRIKAVNLCAEVASKGFFESSAGLRSQVQRLVVNCSWKVSAPSIACDDAFARLLGSNAVVVCSSGNTSSRDQKHYPSDYIGAISVASVQLGDIIWKDSNLNTQVALSAPGGNTTLLNGRGGVITPVNGGGYIYSQGTSFAAPYVSGMLAWLWSMKPNLSAAAIKRIFLQDCLVDIQPLNPDLAGKIGAGRVDAARVRLAAGHPL